MKTFGYDEDKIVGRFLGLQSSRFLPQADKERLEYYMSEYFSAKNDFIKQLNVMSEIETTKMMETS